MGTFEDTRGRWSERNNFDVDVGDADVSLMTIVTKGNIWSLSCGVTAKVTE